MPRFQIEETASRDDAYLKIAEIGPSGGGKTFSALILATGMSRAF